MREPRNGGGLQLISGSTAASHDDVHEPPTKLELKTAHQSHLSGALWHCWQELALRNWLLLLVRRLWQLWLLHTQTHRHVSNTASFTDLPILADRPAVTLKGG